MCFDPSTNTFSRADYLEALRDYLNGYFLVNLSLCDYNTLLETCEPCCYNDFFNKVNYEFLQLMYQQRFGNINSRLYGGNAGYTTSLQNMYNDNVLYCTRNYLTKIDISPNPAVKKYQQYGNGIMGYFPGLTPNEYDIVLNQNSLLPPPFVKNLTLNLISLNLGDGLCSNKSFCVASPPKKMNKPKCDVTDCASFVAAYNAAVGNRSFDKNVDFDEWWDAVYWDMIHDLFGDNDYMTKEQLKLKLLCCGIDIHDIPCDDAFKQMFDKFVNKFRPNGFPTPKQIEDFLNGYFGISETNSYWIVKLSVSPCNILNPDGGNDCDFFRNNFLYAIYNSTGGINDILDILNEDYNLNESDLIFKIKQCYSCSEIQDFLLNAPPFRKMIEDLCGCNSDIDVLNFVRDNMNCDFLRWINDCDAFRSSFNSIMSSPFISIADVLNGLKPRFDLDVNQLMKRLKLCFTCSDLEHIYSSNSNFEDFIKNVFKVSNTSDGLAALKSYFGCEDNTGGAINPSISPDRVELLYSSISSRNYSHINTLPMTKVKESIACLSNVKFNKFYTNISKTSFQDIDVQRLSSSSNIYACASPPAPDNSGNGASSTVSSTPLIQFNTILGLNVDFRSYTCCTYCDKKLYDKSQYRDPKQDPDPCATNMNLALSNAIEERAKKLQALVKEFRANYVKKCVNSAKLYVDADVKDRHYHYTLYYYDQVGNLIQTVPPKGVDVVVPPAQPNHKLASKYWYNIDNQLIKSVEPDKFKLNTSSQTVESNYTIYVYDELGRLIMSQSPKQYPNAFSYSVYDKLNRVIESGEIKDNLLSTSVLYQPNTAIIGDNIPLASAYSNPHKLVYCYFEKLMRYYKQPSINATYSSVVRTYYDNLSSFTMPAISGTSIITENLQNRVAASTLDDIDVDRSPSTYSSALIYSYDIIGNVKKLYTFNNDPSILASEKLKTVDYEYDLPTGKISKLYYQKGKNQQYIHKYSYDQDNRLTSVHTSFDDRLWNREASYKYYLHGPLARTELGDRQIQGLDYIYTLQGWLKSVNGSNIDIYNEPGQDGVDPFGIASPPGPRSAMPANYSVARDAVAYSLDYFINDYKAVLGGTNPNGNIGAKLSTKNLYNGNIVSTKITNSALLNTTTGQSDMMGYTYTYDQLHRIVEMNAFKTSSYTSTPEYMENISYDANGNILKYKRNKDGSTPAMDDLTYQGYFFKNGVLNAFTPGLDGMPTSTSGYNPVTDQLTNQLSSVSDAVSSSASALDVDNQAASNFSYDPNGNLKSDVANNNMTVTWNAMGKVQDVTMTNPYKKISYRYNSMGHRILKRVEKSFYDVQYTYYARDAQGNLIHTYNSDPPTDAFAAPNPKLNEYVVYGLSRIGVKYPIVCRQTQQGIPFMPAGDGSIFNTNTNTAAYTFQTTPCTDAATNYAVETLQEPMYAQYTSSGVGTGPIIGYSNLARHITQYSAMTRYEISNHLGNVLATLKDEPSYTVVGPSGFQRYIPLPIVIEATDYYPFGMPMPGRTLSLSSTKYRFGFNTQEREDEVYGAGNLSTAEFWEYDTRLGRRWNLDPVDQINVSNYAVNSNNPIGFTDPYGDESFGTSASNYNSGGSSGSGSLLGKLAMNAVQSGLNEQISLSNLKGSQTLGYAGGGGSGSAASINNAALSESIATRNSWRMTNLENVKGGKSSNDPFSQAAAITCLVIQLYYEIDVYVKSGAFDRHVEAVSDYTRDIIQNQNPNSFKYVTYFKYNPVTKLVYIGRTSGYGDPNDIVARRDAKHHKNKIPDEEGDLIKGDENKYSKAVLLTSIEAKNQKGYKFRSSDPAYWATRGIEQLMITHFELLDMNGNSINGISPKNSKIGDYLKAAQEFFSNIDFKF